MLQTYPVISVRGASRLVTKQINDALNKCYMLPPVHVIALEPNPSGKFVLKLKNGSDVFSAMVTLENEEGTAELRAKAWGSVMEQLNRI